MSLPRSPHHDGCRAARAPQCCRVRRLPCPAVALRLTSSSGWTHHIVHRRLRIGMCEDDKLGKLLDPALINILNFLGSQSATVKTKAMGILSHLNKRAPAVARAPVHPHAAPLPSLS